MNRFTAVLGCLVTIGAAQASAQLQEVRQTIFGMD